MDKKPLAFDEITLCIVGLGSKEGDQFATHRMGKEFVHFLAAQSRVANFPISFGQFAPVPELHAEVAEGTIGSGRVVLILPTTTMNGVGQCIATLKECGLQSENLIVVHDDINVAPGQYRVIAGRASRAAGHKGVEAVQAQMGSTVGRVKIGVGPIKGDPQRFFMTAHPETEAIQAIFSALLLVFTSVPIVRSKIKVQGRDEIGARWRQYVSQGGERELKERLDTLMVDLARGRGRSVSVYPVLVSESVAEQGRALCRFLLYVLREANQRYERAIAQRRTDDPLVRIVERGISEALIGAVRASLFQPSHLRLDTHVATLQGKQVVQVIELNAAAGGLQLQEIANNLFAGNPALNGLKALSTSPAALLYEHGIKPLYARRSREGLPCVALVGYDGSRSIGKTGNPIIASLIRADGGEVLESVNCRDLSFDEAYGLRLRDLRGEDAHSRRIDVLYALTNYGVQERARAIITPAVSEAVCRGAVQIFPSPRNLLFTSKGFLAALSNPEERRFLGVNDAQWQRWKRHFPWCRLWSAETSDTVEAMRRQDLTFVRKPFFGSGGRGVEVLGPMAYGQESRGAALNESAVAQLFVPPTPVPGATDLSHDLLFALYTDADGQIVSQPVDARVFKGEKVTLTAEGGGAAAVFAYEE